MKNKQTVIVFVVFLVTIALAITCGKTYAKYILTKHFDTTFSSYPFYFEASTDINEASMLQGNFRLNLTIKNYDDNKNFTIPDINYTLKIKENDKFVIDDTSSKYDEFSWTLTGGKANSNQIPLRITTVEKVKLNSLETLTFVITSNSPYNKVIEIPIKVNMPSLATGYVNNFRSVEINDTTYSDTTQAEFDRLYGDHDHQLEYASDGSIVLDSDNSIPTFDRTDRNYTNGYSVYITIKGDIHQWPQPPLSYDAVGNPVYDRWGPATIFAMSDVDVADANRLSWFGFRNGYFQIYSYCNETYVDVDGPKDDVVGFRSILMDEKYNNKILNIQITGIHDGMTNIYFNGELYYSFESGTGNGSFNTATIGDIRPFRGLKFTGNFYDIAVYDRVLTEDEIAQNWNHAKLTWKIE